MSKISLILLLGIFYLSICVPGRRIPNYNEEKLKSCLAKLNFLPDERIEELRDLADAIRYYMFNKKYKEYEMDESKKEPLIECFKSYGLKRRMFSPGANCRDRCYDVIKSGKRCTCPRY